MKICKYCGGENADTAASCSFCRANEFKHKCGNCGTIFDEGLYCPKCGVKVGQKAKKCLKCGNEYYSKACPDCGYIAEPEQSSINTAFTFTNATNPPVKKRRTWLWVLGCIFIFPVPLTILMVKNQRLSKGVKIGIIVLAWLIYFVIGIFGDSGDSSTRVDSSFNNSAQIVESVMI